MFDGGATANESVEMVVADQRAGDWKRLHAEITSVFRERTALKARELELLYKADETGMYRWLGYTSIFAYIEGELGLGHHTATERMRVAYELVELPGISDAFGAGELPWTSVRELTRVVTRETEGAWLDAIEGKRAPQVIEMLRGKGKGALPDDPVDPKKIRYRIVLDDVSAEVYALHEQARIALAEANGGTCTDDQLARAYVASVLEPAPAADEAPRPRHQIAVTTCRTCRAAQTVGAGIEAPISPAELERARCDAEHIGDLESDEPERLTSTIPAAIRRKVFVRDRFRCIVPGCRACRFLEVHHLRPRANGGTHVLSNLGVMCDGHHKQVHDGIITIRGRAPDRLVFEMPHAGDDDEPGSVPAGTGGRRRALST